jgi:hypothetical protein
MGKIRIFLNKSLDFAQNIANLLRVKPRVRRCGAFEI